MFSQSKCLNEIQLEEISFSVWERATSVSSATLSQNLRSNCSFLDISSSHRSCCSSLCSLLTKKMKTVKRTMKPCSPTPLSSLSEYCSSSCIYTFCCRGELDDLKRNAAKHREKMRRREGKESSISVLDGCKDKIAFWMQCSTAACTICLPKWAGLACFKKGPPEIIRKALTIVWKRSIRYS